MYENPGNLQEFCLDYICDHITALCEEQKDDEASDVKLVFKNGEIFFPSTLSDQLLQTFSEKKKLDNGTMSLFDANTANLKRVRIKGSPETNLTSHGMRVLKPHKIIELEASGLKKVSVNELIGCLGEWTLSNLRVLDVSNGTFENSSGFCVLVSLSKLKSLQTLNVSGTQFNNLGLDIIAHDLTSLQSLDISGTSIGDLTPLKKCKDRLKSLAMYNLRCSHTDRALYDILCELTQLRHLDLSDETSVQPAMLNSNLQPHRFQINMLLQRVDSFPELVSLDISGKREVNLELLR